MPPEAIEKIKEVITLKSVLDYLEEAAFQYPEKEAVYDGSQRYSWKRAKTIGAFFGAVYAGCFYVYINPELPLKRIRERLDFLDSDVVVTEGILAERLLEDGFAGRALRFEELVEEEVDMKVLGFYRLQMRPEDYLYGMFTSGSTGAPKLVTVSGGALVEFAEDMILVKI